MSAPKEASQTKPLLRWLAMSIVAAPADRRGVQYIVVRNNLEASIERFGLKGEAAKDLLEKNMDVIRDFVREIEALAADEADAA
jgi:hypothetical protein